MSYLLRLVFIFLLLTSGCVFNQSHDRRNAYLWMHDSYEYYSSSIFVYNSAWERIERLYSQGKLPSEWGVILDLDETVFDNSQFQKELINNNLSYNSTLWNKWEKNNKAELIPGSKMFINKVKSIGGKIVFVSNRSIDTQKYTIKNLALHDIPYDGLYLKKANSDKFSRWVRAIDELKFKPIMWVGDQLSDFPSFYEENRNEICGEFTSAMSYEQKEEDIKKIINREIGRCILVLPNPMYGKWGE